MCKRNDRQHFQFVRKEHRRRLLLRPLLAFNLVLVFEVDEIKCKLKPTFKNPIYFRRYMCLPLTSEKSRMNYIWINSIGWDTMERRFSRFEQWQFATKAFILIFDEVFTHI